MHNTIILTILVLLLIQNGQTRSTAEVSQKGFFDFMQLTHEQLLAQNNPLIEAVSQAVRLLRKSIEALAQLNLTCQSIADCTGVAAGSSICNPLGDYIVYSKQNKYVTTIEELGTDARVQSYLLHYLTWIPFSCEILPVLMVNCLDGICRECTSNNQDCRPAISPPPLPGHGVNLNPGHGVNLNPGHGVNLNPGHGINLNPGHGVNLNVELINNWNSTFGIGK